MSFDALTGSEINVSGGTIDNDFDADSGSVVKFSAGGFFIGDTDITSTLTENVPFTITMRNVVLKGYLADGTIFDFSLNSTNDHSAR